MVESLKNAIQGFAVSVVTALGFSAAAANYFYVFLISMVPIVELRGAIPVAYALGLDPVVSYIVSVIGNLIPVPFILLLITPFCNLLKKTKLFAWFPRWLDAKVEKNRHKVERYAFWGLFIFVAIPFPGTGAWTGSLIASFLDFDFKKSLLAVFLGVCTAGIIMTALSFGLFDAIVGLF
ncbi:MAG: COG2426 family protein [Clostridia bacterium]